MPQFLAQNKVELGPIKMTEKGFTESFGNNPAGRLEEILSSVISVFTIFAGIAFLLYFVIGAVTWATAGGHPETLDKAKNQMGTALTGLVITVIGTALFWILGQVTGLDILNPARLIKSLSPK